MYLCDGRALKFQSTKAVLMVYIVYVTSHVTQVHDWQQTLVSTLLQMVVTGVVHHTCMLDNGPSLA